MDIIELTANRKMEVSLDLDSSAVMLSVLSGEDRRFNFAVNISQMPALLGALNKCLASASGRKLLKDTCPKPITANKPVNLGVGTRHVGTVQFNATRMLTVSLRPGFQSYQPSLALRLDDLNKSFVLHLPLDHVDEVCDLVDDAMELAEAAQWIPAAAA